MESQSTPFNADKMIKSAYYSLTHFGDYVMSEQVNLTPKRIRTLPNPQERLKKIFMWDRSVSGLGVVATKTRKNFIYQGRLKNGKTVRITIGPVDKFTIEKARNYAKEMASLISKGLDPRNEVKRVVEQEEAERLERKKRNITVADIWPDYLEERKPNWSERHYIDHVRLSHPGGDIKKRGGGKTIPGALHSIMDLPLADITPKTVKGWIRRESATRKTQTRLGFEALRAFLNWCEDNPNYKSLAAPDACSTKVKKGNLPQKVAKDDCLQREQLKVWFSAAGSYHNRVLSAYFQTLLLIGARREELLLLRWSDVDFKWQSIRIKDKVDGKRTIPLTPYVGSLLAQLPRRNKWVFSSPASANGRLQDPQKAHRAVLNVAGIEGLTMHGFRRSFGTLSEWIEVPVGIVYQIQGHKPSATAEKHYRKRPLDLLRMWHTKIETWILEQAGIEQSKPVGEESRLKIHKAVKD